MRRQRMLDLELRSVGLLPPSVFERCRVDTRVADDELVDRAAEVGGRGVGLLVAVEELHVVGGDRLGRQVAVADENRHVVEVRLQGEGTPEGFTPQELDPPLLEGCENHTVPRDDIFVVL